MTGDMIRVVLADDHAVVRAGLKAVLGGAKDIEVIGEAKNGREAVTMAERFNPDVVVMDLSMPELDGTAATKEIVQKGLARRGARSDHARRGGLSRSAHGGGRGGIPGEERRRPRARRRGARRRARRRLCSRRRRACSGEESHEEGSRADRTRAFRQAHPARARRPAVVAQGFRRRRSGSGCSSARKPWTRTSSAFRRSWAGASFRLRPARAEAGNSSEV